MFECYFDENGLFGGRGDISCRRKWFCLEML